MGVVVIQYAPPSYPRGLPVDMDYWHAENNAREEGWRMHGLPITAFTHMHSVEGRLLVTFPIWCPMLIFAALSYKLAKPTISWHFSLRTLFIAMTLLSAVSGLAVWLVALEARP